MNISNLIQELERLKSIHGGDKECILESDEISGAYSIAESVKIITTDKKDALFFDTVEDGEYILIS